MLTPEKFDKHLNLSAPEGVDAIVIECRFTPSIGGCVIYGWTAEDTITGIQINGRGPHELPFRRREVWVQFLPGQTLLELSTVGWRDSLGLPDGRRPTR